MLQSLLTIIEIKIGIRITHQGPPCSFVSQQLQKKRRGKMVLTLIASGKHDL